MWTVPANGTPSTMIGVGAVGAVGGAVGVVTGAPEPEAGGWEDGVLEAGILLRILLAVSLFGS